MKKNEYFYLDKGYGRPGFCLRLNEDANWTLNGFSEGSWNLLPARIIGVDYAAYLIYCKTVLGATLYGKNYRYPYPMFKDNDATKQFVKELNKKADEIFGKTE